MGKFIVFVLAFCFLPPAYSGIVMTGSERSHIGGIYIDGGLLRIDMVEDQHGREGSLIFSREGAAAKLIILDKNEKSYYEITSGHMEVIKEQVSEAVKMIKELLEGVDEDQRGQAGPIIMSLVPPEYAGLVEMLTVEKKVVLEEKNARVGKWRADRYGIYHNEAKVTEAWFAGAQQFGLTADDFEVLREFDEFLEIPAPGMVPGLLFSETGAEKSFPLKIVEIGKDGARTKTLEIKEFRKKEIDGERFRVPRGFSEGEISL